MWQYEKKLQFPINIKNTNPTLASYIISQYGGPDGELAASLRYLSQRYSMTDDVCKGLLTDIGTAIPKVRKIISYDNGFDRQSRKAQTINCFSHKQ